MGSTLGRVKLAFIPVDAKRALQQVVALFWSLRIDGMKASLTLPSVLPIVF